MVVGANVSTVRTVLLDDAGGDVDAGGPEPRWNSRCTAEATLTGALTGFLKDWEHHFVT
jgi:hypothetical protein